MSNYTQEQILADVTALINTMKRDQCYGPYCIFMSLERLRVLNPELAAEIEAAGPDIPFRLFYDNDGKLTGWAEIK